MRQALRSTAEGIPYLRNFFLPRVENCFATDPRPIIAFAGIARLVPRNSESGTRYRFAVPVPEQGEALRYSADEALKGRFDVLGIQHLSLGRPVDWHFEP